MPTTRGKAENFVRDMQKAEKDLCEKNGIDRNDVKVTIRVNISDAVTYASDEDKD